MTQETNNAILEVSGKVILTVLGGLLLSGLMALFTLGAWVIEIRANQFTQSDWNEERREILSELRSLYTPSTELTQRLLQLNNDVEELQDIHRRVNGN